MISARLAAYRRFEQFLDTPWRQLTDADWVEVRRDFPDDFALLAAHIRDASAAALTPAHTAIFVDLLRCYPRSLRYYEGRAEDARRRKPQISVGVV
jgi:hypothetical protein